ncbi:MAG: muconolactone Delta-isomerase family protein [Vulcanimicrobiaceae bacterium]
MQFISLSRRRVDAFTPEQFAEHIAAERERVRELYRDGIVRQLWVRQDTPGAIMLLEAEDAGSAQAALDSLPLAQRGMLDVQLVPLGPYPAFFPLG